MVFINWDAAASFPRWQTTWRLRAGACGCLELVAPPEPCPAASLSRTIRPWSPGCSSGWSSCGSIATVSWSPSAAARCSTWSATSPHHPSRHPPRPRAHHRAGPERFRRRGEERRQRLWQEELPRHVRAAVRGAERRRLPRTLHPRDKIAGMAEAVKVALIRDARVLRVARGAVPTRCAPATAPRGRLIRRCAELHMRHIAQGGDPFETGSARPLDFGHWAAHKLETLTAHGCGTARRWPSAWRSTRATRCWSACWRRAARTGCYALLKRLGLRPGIRCWRRASRGRSSLLLRRPRGVPRAPRRRADGHAAARHRRRRRGPRDGRRRDPASRSPGCAAREPAA